MANSIKLKDVADYAGVSIGTASQALNNRPGVADITRTRVLDAARSLGYPLKPQILMQTNLEVIGMLTKQDGRFEPEVSPFYSHVQAGIEDECRKLNIGLMYANILVDPSNHPLAWPAMLTEQRIDGLLLMGTFIEDTVELLQRRAEVPIVLIDSYAPRLSFDSILIDNVQGTIDALEHLMTLGHENIAIIGSNPLSPPSVLERRDVFLHTMHLHGLSTKYVLDSYLTQDSGYDSALAVVKRWHEVTAIFAIADIVAIGAMRALKTIGKRIPEDMSVMGFDNITHARLVTPSLSTIHVHKSWMGTMGVRQLVARARTPGQPKVTLNVATRLIERESTGAPCVEAANQE